VAPEQPTELHRPRARSTVHRPRRYPQRSSTGPGFACTGVGGRCNCSEWMQDGDNVGTKRAVHHGWERARCAPDSRRAGCHHLVMSSRVRRARPFAIASRAVRGIRQEITAWAGCRARRSVGELVTRISPDVKIKPSARDDDRKLISECGAVLSTRSDLLIWWTNLLTTYTSTQLRGISATWIS
jgi:hypothetical protein